MKKSFIKDYAIKNCFDEYLSDVLCEFKKENKQYDDFIKAEENILEMYPKLRKVLEDNEILSLEKEEVKWLLKILKIREKKHAFELREIFKRGLYE